MPRQRSDGRGGGEAQDRSRDIAATSHPPVQSRHDVASGCTEKSPTSPHRSVGTKRLTNVGLPARKEKSRGQRKASIRLVVSVCITDLAAAKKRFSANRIF